MTMTTGDVLVSADRVRLHYSCDELADLDGLDDPTGTAARWELRVERAGGGGGPVVEQLGGAVLYGIDMYGPVPAFDAAATLGPRAAAVARAIFDPETNELVSDLVERLEEPYQQAVLLVDHITLQSHARALQVPVAARILHRLGGGASLAAGQPPSEVRRDWARLGFEPFRDGVWVLDLARFSPFGCLDDAAATSPSAG